MIVQVINRSLELNAQKIIIITGKHNELIQKTVKEYNDEDSFKKLRFVIQETPLGTGHAVKCTLNYYENELNYSLFQVFPDNIFAYDGKKIKEYYEKKKMKLVYLLLN